MLTVPIAWVQVLDAIGFEQDGSVDELGLFGEGCSTGSTLLFLISDCRLCMDRIIVVSGTDRSF